MSHVYDQNHQLLNILTAWVKDMWPFCSCGWTIFVECCVLRQRHATSSNLVPCSAKDDGHLLLLLHLGIFLQHSTNWLVKRQVLVVRDLSSRKYRHVASGRRRNCSFLEVGPPYLTRCRCISPFASNFCWASTRTAFAAEAHSDPTSRLGRYCTDMTRMML